jgi:hypothetical protein
LSRRKNRIGSRMRQAIRKEKRVQRLMVFGFTEEEARTIPVQEQTPLNPRIGGAIVKKVYEEGLANIRDRVPSALLRMLR